MAGGFDRIRRVEGLVFQLERREVALEGRAAANQTFGLVVPVELGELVVVVVDADDRGSGEPGDIAHRPTDTAAHIEHLHSGRQAEASCQEVFGAGEAGLEGLVF